MKLEEHLNITVEGKIQGVGFRRYVLSIAEQLKLKGYVRNQLDGSVYIEVEGEAEKLESFLGKVEKGISYSQVEKIQKSTGKMKSYKSFSIK